MEVAGGKRFLVPHVAPVGHSLLFAVGAWPPQDGVRRTRCLNLSRDLEASLPAGSGLSTRSPRPSSPQERRGSALVRRKLERQLRCDRGRCGLLAPAERAQSSVAGTSARRAPDDPVLMSLAEVIAICHRGDDSGSRAVDQARDRRVAQCISSYQQLGCWTSHVEITRPAFEVGSMSSSISVRSRSDMRTIRFARLRHPQDETKRTETFRIPNVCFAVEGDNVAVAFGQPRFPGQSGMIACLSGLSRHEKRSSLSRIEGREAGTTVPYPVRPLSGPGLGYFVREFGHGRHDPAPGCSPVVTAGKREFVSSRGAVLDRLLAVAFEHQLRCPPNVDLGYHAEKAARSSSIKV